MRRRTYLAIGLLAGGPFLLWFVTSGRQPPRLPADADHGFDQAEARCLGCHSNASRRPRPVGHPLRDDCFSCHRDSAGALRPRPGAPTSLPGGWRDDPRLAAKGTPSGSAPTAPR